MRMIIHPTTEKKIKSIIKGQPHAILLVARDGSGKLHLAKYLGAQFLEINSIETHPYFRHLEARDEGGIDAVRSIRNFLSLKTTGKKMVRRILLISDAQLLKTEAQNALLKVLEEPPEDTIIIMTTSDTTVLLPTILSRVQIVQIQPIGLKQAKKELQNSLPDDEFERSFHLSGGSAGLLISLVERSDHELVKAIEDAKRILKQPNYERLLQVDELSKQRQKVLMLLEALERILVAIMIRASSLLDKTQAKRVHNARQLIDETKQALQANSSVKLALTRLFNEL
jgi:DNA polymerase III delta prime subunit